MGNVHGVLCPTSERLAVVHTVRRGYSPSSRSTSYSANRSFAPKSRSPLSVKMAANGQPVKGMDDSLFSSATNFPSRGGYNHTQDPSAALNYTHRNPCSRNFPSRPPCD